MKNVTIPCGMAPNKITIDEETIRILQRKVCRDEPIDGLHKRALDAILSAIYTGEIHNSVK